jgi:uncharacterized YigZ family protein
MKQYYYKTISQHIRHEIPKIKWSRFIGNIFPISNKQQAEDYIAQVKKQHHNANHNCFAYTYGTNINFDLFGTIEITADSFRQSDDWEPTNTAWKPILAQTQWHNLHNTLIIVTRYFGWTLLWVWWLIQAYWECTKQTILTAQHNKKIINVELTQNFIINIEYHQISIIMQLLNKYNAKIIEQIDWDTAQIKFKINKWYIDTFKKELSDQTKWQIKL